MGRRVLGVLLMLGGCAAAGVPSTPTLLATRAAPERQVSDEGLASARCRGEGCPEVDRDGDQIVAGDLCPDVPGVAPNGCPQPDSDGDGFWDGVDRCWEGPGVEPDGCPIPDADGDGILDPDDRCVRVQETKNGFMDSDGCPDEIPVELAKFTGTLHGVKFLVDKDILKPSSYVVLDQVVAALKKYAEIRFELSGHIDTTGNFWSNRSDISRRRAHAVKKYLVEHGISEARIETRGAGTDEPVDTNKTAAGRAKNRRIELTILVQ